MGNALVTNWTDTQKTLYGIQNSSSNAVGWAIGTVLTHYCVATWIWKTKTKKKDTSPSFIVSLLMFWTLWTLSFNSTYDDGTAIPEDQKRSYYIAFLCLGVPGFLANLLFSFLWNFVTKHETESKDEETRTSLTHPLLLEEQTVTTLDADEETPEIQQITQPPPKKEPVHYINNIKIFLTCVVIIHHSFASFGAWWPGIVSMGMDDPSWGMFIPLIYVLVDASYFMNMFFFYSGYFVPKSFDKKKGYDFLFDRVKRLGIPFTVYTYVLGPYVEIGLASLLFNIPFPNGYQDNGTTWFVNQLMIFSIVYTFACGVGWNPKVQCPSLLGFLIIGATIGLLTGIIMLFFPGGDFFFVVPVFWQDYPSYPIYFFGGAIAQRNGWMEKIKEMPRVAIYLLMILCIILTVCGKLLLPGNVPDVVNTLVSDGIIYKGLVSVTTCLGLSVFFMDYVNKSYFCTKFFSKSMYTAYIIQQIVIQFGLKVMLIVFESTGSIVYDDPSNPSIYNMKFTDSNLALPAWLLTAFIAQAIIWPLSYGIQAIPGFSQVL